MGFGAIPVRLVIGSGAGSSDAESLSGDSSFGANGDPTHS